MFLDDLIVHRATETDAGNYECRVTNAAGWHSDNAAAHIAGAAFTFEICYFFVQFYGIFEIITSFFKY